jgi:hypothetical protein
VTAEADAFTQAVSGSGKRATRHCGLREVSESRSDMDGSISGHVYERMQTLGISPSMVAEALNAPDYVRHLPLSKHLSYFCEFNGRTIRVMTTLEDRVITVSWTTYMTTLRPGVVRRRPRRLVLVRKRATCHRRLNLAYEVRDADTRQLVPGYRRRIDRRIFEHEGVSERRKRAASIRVERAGARDLLNG